MIELSEAEAAKIVEELKAKKTPYHVCIRCAEEYYLNDGKEWIQEQLEYQLCECGGELILKRPE